MRLRVDDVPAETVDVLSAAGRHTPERTVARAAVEPLTVPGSYYPATPYGVYKLIGEEVGKILSKQFGFEFIGLRFGGVTQDDFVKRGEGQTATWLSHDDLLSAVSACLAAEPVAGRSTVFYAVSNNADRIHDTTNPFGWKPKDDSVPCLIRPTFRQRPRTSSRSHGTVPTSPRRHSGSRSGACDDTAGRARGRSSPLSSSCPCARPL